MEKLLRFYGKDVQDIDFEPWLEQKTEVLRPIARKWFNAIKSCGPDVTDIFHDNYPIGMIEDAPFAYVNVYTRHVNLGFFYGSDLPDPAQLLQGTGKKMRHIMLSPDAMPEEKDVRTILQHAYHDIKERLLLH